MVPCFSFQPIIKKLGLPGRDTLQQPQYTTLAEAMTPDNKRSGSNVEKLVESNDSSPSLGSVQVNELPQEPILGALPWKAFRTPVRYSMDDITGASKLVDLENLFKDPFNTLMLKFPS